MKSMRRMASVLLALVMALALTVPAFAADHTYEVYQIFKGDVAGKVLSNVVWGKNGTGTKDSPVDEAILKELSAVASGYSDTEELTVIKKYVNLEGEAYRTGATNKFENVENGYYLIKDQDNSQNLENGYYTLYVVKVVDGTLEFSPKGDVPESVKKIVEGNDRVDINEASIGDTVEYEITGTLPTNLSDYNTYFYVFTDTLSKGLTPVETDGKLAMTVKVDGVDVTKYFYKEAVTDSATGKTTITVGIQDLLALNKLAGVSVTKDSKVVVSYSAILNENAVIAGSGNPNDVTLEYSNDPNNSGTGATEPPEENPDKPETTHPTGDTPKDEVVTYTTELTILKKDGDGNILTGAEFTLTGNGVNVVLVTTEKYTENADGEYWKLKDGTYTTTAPIVTGDASDNSADYDSTETKYSKSIVTVVKGTGKAETAVAAYVGDDGRVTFTGLGVGTYTITETKTPVGYNTIAPISFTLTFNAETKTFVSGNPDVIVGADNKLDTTIINKAGLELPETGGMGTTIFYVLGTVLVLGAGVLLVARKRMSAEK